MNLQTITAERKARLARMHANAVYDDGVDLRRQPIGSRLVKALPSGLGLLEPPKPKPVRIVIPIEAVQEAIQITIKRRKLLSIRAIQRATQEHFSSIITSSDLCSCRRQKPLIWPRHIAMWLSKRYTGRSFPYIGQCFGGRDHTTVLHACKKIDRLLAEATPDILAITEILRRRGFDLGDEVAGDIEVASPEALAAPVTNPAVPHPTAGEEPAIIGKHDPVVAGSSEEDIPEFLERKSVSGEGVAP